MNISQELQDTYGRLTNDMYTTIGDFVATIFQNQLDPDVLEPMHYLNIAVTVLAAVSASHLHTLADFCGCDNKTLLAKFKEFLDFQYLDMEQLKKAAN